MISSPLSRKHGTEELWVAAKPHAGREGQGGGAYALTVATD